MPKRKKLKVLAYAKLQTIIFAFLGILTGIFYSFGGLIIDVFVSLGWLSSISMSTPGLSRGTALAFGSLIGMPIIFAAFGFIAGIVGALLYNLFVRWFGEMNLDIGREY